MSMEQIEVSRDAAKESVDKFVEELRQRMHRALDSKQRINIDLRDVQRVPSVFDRQGHLTLEGDAPIEIVVRIAAKG